MSDLIDDPVAGFNQPEFTVSEISGAIKRLIEGEFSHIRLKGEIGRVSYPRSGHVYLDLKDEKSVISAVVWKGVAARLPMRPEEGLEVVATGRVTTFAGQSKYQLIIEDLRPAGMGALMAMLEKRKAQLAAEGLFDAARKKPLPYLPDVIGVVTSPSGAVIRDILHRLRDRFPRQVLIWPVAVQGERCAGEVSRAIAGFNALETGGAIPRPDLLIVARGGGSLEDLWGFNEESVARAAAASGIPLITAVGHETDTTLIDYVIRNCFGVIIGTIIIGVQSVCRNFIIAEVFIHIDIIGLNVFVISKILIGKGIIKIICFFVFTAFQSRVFFQFLFEALLKCLGW